MLPKIRSTKLRRLPDQVEDGVSVVGPVAENVLSCPKVATSDAALVRSVG